MTSKENEVLQAFHPVVRGWFRRRFRRPTSPQLHGWPAIGEGSHTLISAPTGSGKTLAAFLWCLDHLVQLGVRGELSDAVRILYVSPLKALSNDIQRNLEEPLQGIRALADEEGIALPELRSAVRTGDTPASDRASMVRRPPHILITTPESLFILLTTERFRPALATVRYVIVDEVHALAANKRGVHLSLSLERLGHLAERAPVRIGLSATQHPIEEVARFLVGWEEGKPRPCRIVDVGRRRDLNLRVLVPGPPLGAVATNAIWDATYDRLADLIRRHRTTLIFARSRRLVERLAVRLTERLKEEAAGAPHGGVVAAHHGSLSRRQRLEAEARLKAGEIQAIVATGSLELGIDVGSIDLVCQVEGPRSLATAIQRVGRSGHWVGATPKGRLFALTQDDLLECAAVVRALREGLLDRVEAPRACLDVLAQQVVAEAATEEWDVEELYHLFRRSHSYRDLSPADFRKVLVMLSERLPTEPKGVYPKISWDRVREKIRDRRGARLSAITSGGTIPDTTQYDVFWEAKGLKIGQVEEDFAQESLVGDIFSLGNASWRILGIRRGRMAVENAEGLPPTIPFWHGEAPGRTFDLSLEVARLRSDIASRLEDPETTRWLAEEAALDEEAARVAVEYVSRQRAAVGVIPTDKVLLAERFFDNLGGTQIVLHAPYGMRVNRAWGLALSKVICRTFQFEIQSAATDEAILLSLGPHHSFPLETIFHFLTAEGVKETLVQAILAAPLFETRFRQCAVRALLILRHAGGRRVPAFLQRLRATDLLSACFPMQQVCLDNRPADIEVSDHPLVQETLRECLEDALDLPRLEGILRDLKEGTILAVAKEVPIPSPFAHQILAAWDYSFLDGAPREERRSRTVQAHRAVNVWNPRDGANLPAGFLDEEAISRVAEEVSRRAPGRRARDEHELLELLKETGPLPEEEIERRVTGEAKRMLTLLQGDGRAVGACLGGRRVWIATELLPLCRAAYPGLKPEDEPPLRMGAEERSWTEEEARIELVRRRLRHSGPMTAEEISHSLGLPPEEVSTALLALEAEGAIFRGNFSARLASPQWCERTLLERLHRLTLSRLRKEAEPVSPTDFVGFLFQWQHVTPGSRLYGLEGLEETLSRLQGLELPAEMWERDVLPLRVADYRPEHLDQLCLSGQVVWGRVKEESPKPRGPGPIAFFGREALFHLGPRPSQEEPALSDAARTLRDVLGREGASFPHELSMGTGLSPTDVLAALWELSRAGLVTNDSFTPVRFMLSLRGRPGVLQRARSQGKGQGDRQTLRLRAKMRSSLQGRWSLLARRRGTQEERLEAWALQLLERYGILFRELLALETEVPAWKDIAWVCRRLEWGGRLRRGIFLDEVSGEQYALPAAVELLRSRRKARAEEGWVVLSAADPCNLYGTVFPFPKMTRRSGDLLVLHSGRPLLLWEGGRILLLQELGREEVRRALGELIRERRGRRLLVERWNDEPVLLSRACPLLTEAGFHMGEEGLVFDGLPGPRVPLEPGTPPEVFLAHRAT